MAYGTGQVTSLKNQFFSNSIYRLKQNNLSIEQEFEKKYKIHNFLKLKLIIKLYKPHIIDNWSNNGDFLIGF